MPESLTIHGLDYRVTATKEGGMGRVFLVTRQDDPSLALDRVFRRNLAIKTFRDGEFEQQFAHLFERELNVWISLEVPAVAPLLLAIRLGDRLHALMPQYTCSLSDYLEREGGRLSPTHAAVCLIVVISCLSGAWKHYGVVHLDLKPANILVDLHAGQDGDMFKVSDWGLASIQREWSFWRHPRTDLSRYALTMAGLGTLPYMAPERLAGTVAGPQADIYSVGMMLYELTTGGLPFIPDRPLSDQVLGGTYVAIADRVLRARGEGDLQRTVLRAIDPDLASRYAHYEEVARALARLL